MIRRSILAASWRHLGGFTVGRAAGDAEASVGMRQSLLMRCSSHCPTITGRRFYSDRSGIALAASAPGSPVDARLRKLKKAFGKSNWAAFTAKMPNWEADLAVFVTAPGTINSTLVACELHPLKTPAMSTALVDHFAGAAPPLVTPAVVPPATEEEFARRLTAEMAKMKEDLRKILFSTSAARHAWRSNSTSPRRMSTQLSTRSVMISAPESQFR